MPGCARTRSSLSEFSARHGGSHDHSSCYSRHWCQIRFAEFVESCTRGGSWVCAVMLPMPVALHSYAPSFAAVL